MLIKIFNTCSQTSSFYLKTNIFAFANLFLLSKKYVCIYKLFFFFAFKTYLSLYNIFQRKKVNFFFLSKSICICIFFGLQTFLFANFCLLSKNSFAFEAQMFLDELCPIAQFFESIKSLQTNIF